MIRDNKKKGQQEKVRQNNRYCDIHESCVMSWFKGSSNAFNYAFKVRFVHSLVMQLLFGQMKDPKIMLMTIYKQVKEHTSFLTIYVFCYKMIQCGFHKMFQTPPTLNGFMGGLITGYYQNRVKTPMLYQIILYLSSRKIFGIINYLQKVGSIPNFDYFQIIGVLSWGTVMFLFEKDKSCLQPSLVSSMEFLYKESDKDLESYWQLVPLEKPSFLQLFQISFLK